jgi:hypothetical protein
MPNTFHKVAYAVGVDRALRSYGLKTADEKEEKVEEKPAVPQSGKETRLKLDHNRHDFYGVKRLFERASTKKKEEGIHVPQVSK